MGRYFERGGPASHDDEDDREADAWMLEVAKANVRRILEATAYNEGMPKMQGAGFYIACAWCAGHTHVKDIKDIQADPKAGRYKLYPCRKCKADKAYDDPSQPKTRRTEGPWGKPKPGGKSHARRSSR